MMPTDLEILERYINTPFVAREQARISLGRIRGKLEWAKKFIDQNRYTGTGACAGCGVYLDKLPHDQDCSILNFDKGEGS